MVLKKKKKNNPQISKDKNKCEREGASRCLGCPQGGDSLRGNPPRDVRGDWVRRREDRRVVWWSRAVPLSTQAGLA